MALPAFGAEEPAPASAPEEATPTSDPTQGESTPAVEPELVEAVPALPPVPPGAVARGTFATAVDQREPVDSITSLGNDRNRVYYFNEFVGISGRRVAHRWEYEGEVMAEVPIAIGGPRWRAYSIKNLDADQLGKWTVSVIDESGDVVRKDSFVYEAAAPAPEIAAPATTPAPKEAPVSGEAPDEAPASPPSTQP
jgi:hypothetical protein